MTEPTDPTRPTPVTPSTPPTEAPAAPAGGAAPPPPPTTTWSTAPPADGPDNPYAAPVTPAPTVGRNLAIAIAVAALLVGGVLGALIAHVAGDGDSGGRTRVADGRGGPTAQYGDQGQMPMGPRGVDPDGDNWTGGGQQGQAGRADRRGVDPDGDDWTGGQGGATTPSTPTTPTTPTTTPTTPTTTPATTGT